jgi:DNA invertase Pin-like site-specific DNA recombinase
MLSDSTASVMARPPKARVPAIAYLRTSSATNVGADKDSDKRQRQAIETFAKHGGYELVAEHYDTAVSGADPIETRPGFVAMLERIESNGVRTIIVETANRFARDLMVQEVGFARLQERGISLIAADSPNAFLDDTPTAKLMRQVLGAIAEFDKAMTVAKLRGARDRKRKAYGKCEGRKSLAEMFPAVVREAKRLGRANPRTGERRSLRKIAKELAKIGEALTATGTPGAKEAAQAYFARNGQPYSAKSVRAMLVQRLPDSPAPQAS